MPKKSSRLKFIVLVYDDDDDQYYGITFQDLKDVKKHIQHHIDSGKYLNDIQLFHGVELNIKTDIDIDLKP